MGNKPHGIYIGGGWHWLEQGHILTCGGTGMGKGQNLILPALTSDGLISAGVSTVVFDPKGENAAVSAEYLRRNGYDVHILNPFGIKEIAHLGNSRWNPFDLFTPNTTKKLADVLSYALHNRQGGGGNEFFDKRCRQYISLYIRYALHVGKGNFNEVFKWLRYSGDKRKGLLSEMASNESFAAADLADAISNRLTSEAIKTEESIYSTIEEAIDILEEPALQQSLSVSDFDMRNIADRPTAIFLCVPFQDIKLYKPWVRMFFDLLSRVLIEHHTARKVLLLLDEFPKLGYMNEVQDSISVLRTYNVSFWLVTQDLNQIKSLYGDIWETFISSSVIKHWLGTGGDNFTAEYIAKRMPHDSIFVPNLDGKSSEEIKKSLLEPHEVMTFTDIICEITGLNAPARFPKIPYRELPYCAKNAAPNPFHKI